jgi:hypothetical protein
MLITYNHFDNHFGNHFDNHFDNGAEDDRIMHLFSRYTVFNYYNVHNHLTITLKTVLKTIIYSEIYRLQLLQYTNAKWV